jgi:hypothetical protein
MIFEPGISLIQSSLIMTVDRGISFKEHTVQLKISHKKYKIQNMQRVRRFTHLHQYFHLRNFTNL